MSSYGNTPSGGKVIGSGLLGILGLFVVFSMLYGFFGLVGSYKNTDPGEVCVVRQGGWFDGKAVIEVRQPGEGRKFIGAYNKQICLPSTERDTNGILDVNQTEFPTKDGVQVIVDGQGLFSITTNAALVTKFYNDYGRRSWDGKSIDTDEGRNAFFKTRMAPVVADTIREVIGDYNCIDLNNLCQYVTSPEDAVQGKTKQVANSQNLSEASRKIAAELDKRLKAAFKGNSYFENIRYQNLRIRFEQRVNEQIQASQATRTATANAKLDAERKKEEARGVANQAIEKAKGARESAFQQAKAYRLNPTQRDIDKITAFCGPEGCNPSVIGGSLEGIIANLGSQGK